MSLESNCKCDGCGKSFADFDQLLVNANKVFCSLRCMELDAQREKNCTDSQWCKLPIYDPTSNCDRCEICGDVMAIYQDGA